ENSSPKTRLRLVSSTETLNLRLEISGSADPAAMAERRVDATTPPSKATTALTMSWVVLMFIRPLLSRQTPRRRPPRCKQRGHERPSAKDEDGDPAGRQDPADGMPAGAGNGERQVRQARKNSDRN